MGPNLVGMFRDELERSFPMQQDSFVRVLRYHALGICVLAPEQVKPNAGNWDIQITLPSSPDVDRKAYNVTEKHPSSAKGKGS